ncbi:MAG TPA: hypothetical protein PLA68_03600 [Panacibacter sp.]|nr:hypothetical protein [Panacibacter sp.]
MKIFIHLAIITILSCSRANAQQLIDGLIASEKNFAKTSKEQSTKKAFLAFVDSNCVGFSGGEQVNVFKEWMNRKEDGSKLTWAPGFVIISSSGEMGVTTGPWEYREKSLNDTAVAQGHFTTVWKKNKQGRWKAVFDMGISYPEKIANSATIKKFEVSKPVKSITAASLLINTEMTFIDAFASDHNMAIKRVLVPDSWFNINNMEPLKNAAAINAAINNIPANTVFKSISLIASNNGDMFAAYGVAQTGDKKQNYMRLWVRQNAEWKLLMMVIH